MPSKYVPHKEPIERGIVQRRILIKFGKFIHGDPCSFFGDLEVVHLRAEQSKSAVHHRSGSLRPSTEHVTARSSPVFAYASSHQMPLNSFFRSSRYFFSSSVRPSPCWRCSPWTNASSERVCVEERALKVSIALSMVRASRTIIKTIATKVDLWEFIVKVFGMRCIG